MEVRVSAAALAHVLDRGGRLFLYVDRGIVAAATEPPAERRYVRQPARGFDLYLPEGLRRRQRVRVELRALPEPHLVAYDDDLQR